MSDDLLEALSGPPPKDKRTRCYYADEWLPSQTPERQEAIEAAMQNHKWKTTDLYALLKDKGYERQYNSLRLHRTGACSCND